MTTIYALLDDDQIRYIGKTTHPDLNEKLKQHLEDAFTTPDKFQWINDLWKKGSTPRIKSIFKYNDNEAEFYERLFIDHFKFFSGLRVTNINSFNSQKWILELKTPDTSQTSEVFSTGV